MRRSFVACLRSAFGKAFRLAFPVLVIAYFGAAAAAAEQTSGEQRTAQELESIRSEPLLLRDFLLRMPKGADLHLHLTGAAYAESHISAAAEDGLCVDPVAKSFTKSQPVMAERSTSRSLRSRVVINSTRETDPSRRMHLASRAGA